MQARSVEQILTSLACFTYFMLGVYQADYYLIPIITFFYLRAWLFLNLRLGGHRLQATIGLFVLTTGLFVFTTVLGFILYFFGQCLFAS